MIKNFSDNKLNPFFAMVPKNEKFLGKNLVIPIIYSNPQGRSAQFSNAQANKVGTKIKDFTITRNHDYALASIDNETIEASQGSAHAFMEASTLEIDGALNAVSRSLAIALYGSGTGNIGRISAINTLALTLVQVEDVTNFEVGMKLNFSTANGGGSVKGTVPTITGIDRDNGIVTVSDATGLAVNDYIFVDGDYDAKLKGLAAWLPATLSGGDNFFGLNRNADKSRLAGLQFNGQQMPIEEALIGAASRVSREGGKPTHVFLSYAKYADLEKSLGSKVQYIDMKVTQEIAFRGIVLNSPRGQMRIIADQNCPADKAYMLQLDTWKLNSLGKAPKILNLDGLKYLREAAADAIEVRVGYYAQLSCKAPGYNVAISW